MNFVQQKTSRNGRWVRLLSPKGYGFSGRSRWRYYVYAVLLAAVLDAIRIHFYGVFDNAPFVLPTIAVFLCAWFFGLTGGLLAIALNAATEFYFFETPFGSVSWHKLLAQDQRGLAGFIILGLIIDTMLTVLRNIRSRVETQEKLFRSMIENSSTAVGIMQPDGTMSYISPTITNLLGYDPAEIVGTNSLKLIHPEDLEYAASQLAELAEPGKAVTAAVRVKHKDGSWRYLECSANNRLNDKAIGAIIVNFSDVSGRRIAEEQALRARERLELAQAAGRIGTFEWNIKTNKVNWSAETEALYGLPPGSFGGDYANWRERLHPDDRQFAERAIVVAAAKAQPVNIEYRVIRPDGQIRWIAAKGTVVKDANGRPERMVGVNMEFTERKRIENNQSFMVQVSKILASTLNYEAALQQATELAVNFLADWCIVELWQEDGSLKNVAIAHRDPAKVKWARELEDKYSPNPDAPVGIGKVLKTKQAEFVPLVTDEAVQQAAQDAHHLEVLRQLGMSSVIIVPILVRDEAIGTISLVQAESNNHYRESDLGVAHSFAERAAAAIDNAQLYRETLKANTELENRVKERTLELSRSEQQYRSMFDALQDVYYRTNDQGVITMVSPSIYTNWGYKPEEVIGHPAAEFYADISERQQMVDLLTTKGRVTDYELRMRNKQGGTAFVSLNAHVILDSEGNPTGVEGLLRDIGGRKKAEEELRREKEFSQGLITSSNDGIVAMDTNLCYTVWNLAMEEMTGKKAKEVIGHKSYEVFPFLKQQGVIDNFVKPALEGIPGDTGTVKYDIPETGRHGYFEARYSAIKDITGKVIGVLGSIRDVTQREIYQQALLNSQAALKEAQRLAHVGSWEWDIDSGVFTGSDEMARILGVNTDGFALSLDALSELVQSQHQRAFKKAFNKIIDGQPEFEIEFNIVRPEGWIRILHAQGQAANDHNGRAIGASGTIQDITDRKLSEEVIRQSEQRFRALAENANDIIISTDGNGDIAYFNPAAERSFGYLAGEMLAKPIDIVLPGQSEFLQTIVASEEIDNAQGLEITGKHKDGHQFLLELSLASWDINNEKYLIITMRDITERRRTENAIRESEEKLRLLIEGVQDYAIFMLDPEGKVISWNPGAERIKGYSEAEILGQHISIFYPESDQTAGKPQQDLAKAAKNGKYQEEAWRQRKNGEMFYASLLLTALYNEDGSVRGYSKITQDITERKELEQMKGDFVSLVSHQLKTPVALIRGYVENILSGVTDGELSEQQRSYLTDIQEISAKNYSLISDLLNVSRIERGVIAMDIKPTKLRDVLHLALRGNQQRIEQKGLELQVRQSDPEVMVVADKFKMAEAIANIIDNAIKFTDTGSITVQGYIQQDWVYVEVTDTGRGLDPSQMDTLFTRDKVLSGSPRPDSGSGLGLYIARQFMRMQGGYIEASSLPGQGTKFTFRIPLAKVKARKAVRSE